MSIRKINKYTVKIRFSLSSKMFDQNDTVYIQEIDEKNQETQIVFDGGQEYVTDITPETYLQLKKEFIEPNDGQFH